MHRYRALATLRYWKPIQTGADQDDDTGEVERLGGCQPVELFTTGIRLAPPVSPHLAARLSRVTIDLQQLAAAPRAVAPSVRWVVEGAGGVLVPINDVDLMVDLIRLLGLATVVVARSTLGTINHTLLTLEALRRRGRLVAGVVMVGERNAENRAAIERYGSVAVLGEMPCFSRLTAAEVGSWATRELDRENQLLQFFQ
jgi:dethiobiotin synthase